MPYPSEPQPIHYAIARLIIYGAFIFAGIFIVGMAVLFVISEMG